MEQIINFVGLVVIYGAVSYASDFTIKIPDKKWMISLTIVTIGYMIIVNSSTISNSL